MSSGSSTLSKIKVGRQWGYPIIVTTGKSKHEAILLDCNTDNPQDILEQNAEVKIRWKVAMYNESVPSSDVMLQSIDTVYNRSRKAAAAVAASKKRKANAIGTEEASAVSSGVNVKEEAIETDNDEDDEKPAAVASGINVKEEEVETDNDDEKKPAAVTSGIKTEDVETDDEEGNTKLTGSDFKTEEIEDKEDDRKPAAVTSSGGAVKTEEEIETEDDDDDGKPQAVTSSGVAVKTEEIETDDENGEDDRKPEAHVPSSGGDAFKEETDNEEDEETTLVEFKFCSISTMTNNYELEGTLHIPMLQDATTGIYSLPMGKTKFRGNLNRDKYNGFEGGFVKSKGKSYCLQFDIGMDVVRVRGGSTVYLRENIPLEYTEWSYPLKCMNHSHSWEREQGGELVAYKNGCKKNGGVKLYTVLSVHKPNEEPIAPLPEGYEPDWNFLVNAYHARLEARRGNDKDLGYAQAAVTEYRHFLELKVEHTEKDTKSAGYSPSVPIDDVWHTHISFLRRYQCDTLYLTRGKRVIEHVPVMQEDSRRAYNKAYYAHSEKMGKEGRSIDERFWPLPFKIKERRMHAMCG